MQDDKTLVRNTAFGFVLQKDSDDSTYPVFNGATVGRQEDCDIVLQEGFISRLHASFQVAKSVVVVKDEGSENGTFVNGLRIRESVVKPGDSLKFDNQAFKLMALNAETENDPEKTLLQATVQIEEKREKKSSDAAETLVMQIPETESSAQTVVMQSEQTLEQKPERELDDSRDTVQIARQQENVDEEAFLQDHTWLGDSEQAEGEYVHLFGYSPSVFDDVYPLDKQVILVGKAKQADICVNDTSISTEHAELYWENGYWIVEDLGSTNGTFVNGQPIEQPVVLRQGDFLQFGLVQMVFGQTEPGFYTPKASGNLLAWIALGAVCMVALAALIYFLF